MSDGASPDDSDDTGPLTREDLEAEEDEYQSRARFSRVAGVGLLAGSLGLLLAFVVEARRLPESLFFWSIIATGVAIGIGDLISHGRPSRRELLLGLAIGSITGLGFLLT